MGQPRSSTWVLIVGIALIFQCSTDGSPASEALNTVVTGQKCYLSESKEKMVCTGVTGDVLSLSEVLATVSSSPSGIFKKSTASLRKLEFRHGNISVIRRGTFKQIDTISQLTIHNMSLKTLENGAFEGLTHLKFLDLSHNDLRDNPPDLFKWMGLKHLRLDGNPYLSIPTNGPLIDAPKLQWLSLRHCGIQHLPGVAFSKTPYLTHLDLSSNRLEQLPEVVFENTSLMSLDLSNNKFQTLNLAVFQHVPGYPRLPRAVLLAGNRWHCDCRLAAVVTWLAEDLDTHYPTEDPARSRLQVQTSCTTPAKVAAVSWNKFEEWNCNV